MNYKYNVLSIDKTERWIFITSNDEFGSYEPDSFVFLLKKIRDDVNGKIIDIGNDCYLISGDKLNLQYQWDSCFGITVVYPYSVTEIEAMNFLEKYF